MKAMHSCKPFVMLAIVGLLLLGIQTGGVNSVFADPLMAGPALWLKADAGITLNGSQVSGWADQSGNGLDVTQGDPLHQPLFVANGVSSKPILRFSGDDYLRKNSIGGSALFSETAATAFIVVKQANNNNTNPLLLWIDNFNPGNARFQIQEQGSDNTLFFDLGNPSNGGLVLVQEPAFWKNAWHLLVARRDGNNGTIRVDGVTLPLMRQFSAPGFNFANGDLWIGSDLWSNFFEGDLAEIMVFNTALSDADLIQTEGMLQAKYGLPSPKALLPVVLKNHRPPPPVFPPINKIVYVSGYTIAKPISNIYVMNPDGTGQMQITNQSSSNYLKPSWSPDSSRIAFTAATPIGNNDYDDQIYIMNADGSGKIKLLNIAGHHFDPTWSPYGDKIAFSSDLFNPGANTPNDIYAINADGSGSPVNLTNSPASHDFWPDWSLDGKKIAYTSCTGADYSTCQIYAMNSDGSGQVNVSNYNYNDYAPNWSPDGKRIVFFRDYGSSTQINVMNADGSGQTLLTNNGGQNFYPNWSPDGTKIAFQTYYNNYADLYIMNADGTGVTNITNHQFSYASVQPDWR